MKRISMASIMSVAAALVLAGFTAGPANLLVAQTTQRGAAAPVAVKAAPRMPDGHPDLSGVWWGGSDVGGNRGAGGARGGAGGARGTPPPSFTSLYQPWAA